MTIQTFIIEFSFINKKNIKKRLIEKINKPFFVELRGVEPRSEHETTVLSTCLVFI